MVSMSGKVLLVGFGPQVGPGVRRRPRFGPRKVYVRSTGLDRREAILACAGRDDHQRQVSAALAAASC